MCYIQAYSKYDESIRIISTYHMYNCHPINNCYPFRKKKTATQMNYGKRPPFANWMRPCRMVFLTVILINVKRSDLKHD